MKLDALNVACPNCKKPLVCDVRDRKALAQTRDAGRACHNGVK